MDLQNLFELYDNARTYKIYLNCMMMHGPTKFI
jgi:hypothetical protein